MGASGGDECRSPSPQKRFKPLGAEGWYDPVGVKSVTNEHVKGPTSRKGDIRRSRSVQCRRPTDGHEWKVMQPGNRNPYQWRKEPILCLKRRN